MSWPRLGDWWLDELAGDVAYETVVTPLLVEVLAPVIGATYLDLGCGEGRVMRTLGELGSSTFGIEVSEALAVLSGPTVLSALPVIPLQANSVDGAYAVLVLEHLEDHRGFFAETARVTRSSGVLAVVMNHPVWTAPESTPIQDSDGEILLRPGHYFSPGSTDVAIGEHTVTFFHRSMADLLTNAADAGWMLERLVERPHHDIHQPGIPRLLACRWRLVA